MNGNGKMNQRRATILDHLARNMQATVPELAELAEVSMVTLRQDLNYLESSGFIRRTHGGAALLESDNIAHRLSIRYEKKLAIARAAAGLVRDGETVLLESGSANALLARELAGRRVQLVVANLFVAQQVRPGDLAKVVVLGGIFQPDSQSVVGALARQNIAATFFTRAFLGMDGYTPETGVTNRDMERAEIAAKIVERCTNTYFLADSSKFGVTGMARICGLEEVAGVITNRDLPEAMLAPIRKTGVELHLT